MQARSATITGSLILLLSMFLAACAGIDLPPTVPETGVSATAMATDEVVAATTELLPTSLPSDEPSTTSLPGIGETPALMCTPPACAIGETYVCPSGDCPGGCGTVCAPPTPITGPLGPAPTDWESLETWLTTLWRGDVNPAAVRAALQQSGMQKSLEDWRAADLDGDLRDEWILVLYDQSLPGVPFGSAGDLWVVNGEGVIFRYYTAPSTDIYEFIAPTVVSLADLTGDGLPELITDATICGAHTCYNNYRITGLRDGALVDLVLAPPVAEGEPPGTAITMSYADSKLADVDNDGLPEFLVHGGTIGSAGAGVVRPRTEVWGWDGTAVSLAETILDPSGYRHHILYEANDRMAAGDLDGALALYETAINDAALRDDGFAHAPEQTRADISAFAAFRLILIDLMQGNAERAASRLAWLQMTYPESPTTGAALTLVSEWAGPDGAAALCARIEDSMATLDNPTGALADMGYGNPSLGAADFCP